MNIKLTQLKELTSTIKDNTVFYIVQEGESKKITYKQLKEYLKGLDEAGLWGSINPTTNTENLQNGFYIAEKSGTYTNANNIVVEEGYYTILEKNDNGWKKSTEVKMPTIPITGKVEQNNVDAVNGGEVYNSIQETLASINLNFGGEIIDLNQSPNVQGMYIPKVNGIYPNFGNLEYDPIEGFTLFLYKDNQFSKVVVPLNTVEGDVNFNNNVTGVSGSAVEKYAVKKVNTIADLRNTNGEYEGQIITLLGYYDKGDKEPLNYKWTLTQGIDDGGNVINSENGCWLAIFENSVSSLHFGGKNDGIFDNIEPFERCLLYCNNNGKVMIIPKGINLISRTFKIQNNSHIKGYGHTTGGSFIKGNFNGSILSIKKDNFIPGTVSSWIYASIFDSFGIVTDNDKINIGIEVYGLSESLFRNVSLSNMDTAIKMIDCSIDRFEFPIISYCKNAFDFSSYNNERFVVNANIVIDKGDYYDNDIFCRLNSVDGLYLANGNWVESNGCMFEINNFENRLVELRNIHLNNANILFNKNNYSGFINIRNDDSSTINIRDFNISYSSINIVKSLTNNDISSPIKIIAEDVNNLTNCNININDSVFYGEFESLIDCKSWYASISMSNNRIYNSNNYEFIKEFSVASIGNHNCIKNRNNTILIGKDNFNDTECLLSIKEIASTTVKIHAGSNQYKDLLELFDYSGQKIFAILKNGGINSNLLVFEDNNNAKLSGLKIGDFYRNSVGDLKIVY